MRTLFILAGAFLLTAAVNAQDKAIEKGKEVYTAQKCRTCHAIDGQGSKKGPLDGVGTKLTAAEIREWIMDAPAMTRKTNATRKPAMKSYKLAKDDLDALVAYMASLRKK